MEFNVSNFFSHLIFHPEDAKEEDYNKSLCTSIALGILTVGLIPLAVSIGWLCRHTYEWITEDESEVEAKTNTVKNQVFQFPEDPGLKVLPEAPLNWKNSFIHTDILNSRAYLINGKKVELREPSYPKKIERKQDESLEDLIQALRLEVVDFAAAPPNIQIKDMTTDQAIHEGDQYKIALNFANEHHAGGGPGIYKDIEEDKIKWGGTNSALAQEEALVNKSDLFLSLTLLPTTPEKRGNDTMIRNYYANGGFDSKKTAYTSDNQLFGIQAGDFYTTQFLEDPCDVSFVTSAATCYGSDRSVLVAKDFLAYKDAQERIRTHLYAAATKAVEMKKLDSEKPVELILGAFGCGAFAPNNARAYATMMAKIYKEELPQFDGFFDEITFAIPKMGITDPDSSFVRNFDAFNEVLNG